MNNISESLSTRAKKDLENNIEDYKRLVARMAYKYRRNRVEYEDLMQEAMVGLILADREFDETRSKNFHTYAIYRMKGKMYEYCIANESPIYVPTHVAKAASYIKQMQRLLDKEPATLDNFDHNAVMLNNSHPDEEKLPKKILADLKELKRKLARIAYNADTPYERLAGMAMDSISFIVSDEVLSKFPREEVLDEQVSDREFGTLLEDLLGEKKFTVLKMRSAGWNYREIAEKLCEMGYTNRQGKCISRQAVKGILDETIKVIKKSKVFSDLFSDIQTK